MNDIPRDTPKDISMTSPDENPYRPPGVVEPATDSVHWPDDRLVARGRTLFLVIAGYVILLSVIVLASDIKMMLGLGRPLPVGSTLALAFWIGILFAAWHGRGWAVFLLLLGRVVNTGALLVASFGVMGARWLPASQIALADLGIEVAVLLTLVFSKSLREFFSHQKEQRRHRRRAVSDVAFPCEECGKPLSFPAERRGKVEVCWHCGKYVDVPE